MERKKNYIRTELVRHNKTIIPDGFYCINFNNQGEDMAVLMGTIEMKPGQVHEFNFDNDEEIDTRFSIQFAGESDNKQIVVTTIYTER